MALPVPHRDDDLLCACCGEAPALDDGPFVNTPLCGQCATELAYDAAEMAGEDCRVGLCCSNAPGCGGLCPGGSY